MPSRLRWPTRHLPRPHSARRRRRDGREPFWGQGELTERGREAVCKGWRRRTHQAVEALALDGQLEAPERKVTAADFDAPMTSRSSSLGRFGEVERRAARQHAAIIDEARAGERPEAPPTVTGAVAPPKLDLPEGPRPLMQNKAPQVLPTLAVMPVAPSQGGLPMQYVAIGAAVIALVGAASWLATRPARIPASRSRQRSSSSPRWSQWACAACRCARAALLRRCVLVAFCSRRSRSLRWAFCSGRLPADSRAPVWCSVAQQKKGYAFGSTYSSSTAKLTPSDVSSTRSPAIRAGSIDHPSLSPRRKTST